jgi:putative pyruvate formate lyase activating enzyme
MLKLQDCGCHNINLVSPTHFVPQILDALRISVEKGLDIPIVYNTSGYDLPDTIKLLNGIVDIYLPDMRYSDKKNAKIYSDAADYPEYNRACIKQMHEQVGDLMLDKNGIAVKGLIIRLLVLPGDISGTADSLRFIKEEVSPNSYLSIMSQYYPTYKAHDFKELSRGTTAEEYSNIVDEAGRLGLNNGWIQQMPEGPDDKFLGTKIAPKRIKGKDRDAEEQ